MKEKEWIELTIVTSSEALECVSGILYSTGVKGIAIQDPEDIEFKKQHPGDWDYFDESLLNVKENAVIKAYYKDDEKINKIIEYIKKKINELDDYGIDKGPAIVEISTVNEEDWQNNWKKYYKPTKIGEKIVVKPLWENYNKKDEEIIIQLDPGMAFGTGTHETTRMCIKALEKYVKKDSIVFDIGTGSGILSIASSKLNAKKVIGVDLDPVAVESAKENVNYNNIDNIEILNGDLMNVVKGKADIIVANIFADIIIQLSKDIKEFINDNGIFIASGIILSRKKDVEDKLKELGFNIKEVNIDGEWVCIVSEYVQ